MLLLFTLLFSHSLSRVAFLKGSLPAAGKEKPLCLLQLVVSAWQRPVQQAVTKARAPGCPGDAGCTGGRTKGRGANCPSSQHLFLPQVQRVPPRGGQDDAQAETRAGGEAAGHHHRGGELLPGDGVHGEGQPDARAEGRGTAPHRAHGDSVHLSETVVLRVLLQMLMTNNPFANC